MSTTASEGKKGEKSQNNSKLCLVEQAATNRKEVDGDILIEQVKKQCGVW